MRFFLIGLIFLCSATHAVAKCNKGEKVIRFGTFTDSDHANRERAAKILLAAIDKELQGKFCTQLMKDEERFKGALAVTALQNGDVDIIAPSFATLAKFSSTYRVFELPFAFSDWAVLDKFQAAQGDKFVEAMSKNSVQPLAFWHGDFSQISAARPVHKPGDVAGQKFRTNNGEYFSDQMELLKATSEHVTENKLMLACQSGDIKAQITNWVQLQADGTGKVLDGVTETNHRFSGYQLMTSKNWWAGQDPATRKILIDLIGRLSRQANFEAVSRASSAKQALMRSNVAVRTLTNQQRLRWKSAMQRIWDKFPDSEMVTSLQAVTQ